MTKRNFAMIGMVVGLVVAFCGILTIFGAMGGNTGSANSAPYLYDSGYASFGADFYSYVCNNAAEAADGAQKAASNLNELANLLKNVLGILLIGIGLIAFSCFGMIWSGTEKPEKVNKNIADVPTAEVTEEQESGNVEEMQINAENTEIEVELSDDGEIVFNKSEE